MTSSMTTPRYWDQYWKGTEAPNFDLRNPVYQAMHSLFCHVLDAVRSRKKEQSGIKVMDVGCGTGLLLSYFLEHHPDLEVHGIDNSEAVEIAAALPDAGKRLKVRRCDLFAPEMKQADAAFDLVVSAGLVEHFASPVEPMRAMCSLLSSVGCLITIIPNFEGLYAYLWRLYDRENYQKHVPLSRT